MPRGGARINSGPAPDPASGRSDRRGYSLTALPAEGYSGEVPDFPLPRPRLREKQLWAWAWTTPQACAWSMPPQRWRIYSVALWVRAAYVAERSTAKATDRNAVTALAAQIGFTDAGLAQMGWRVATDQLAARAAAKEAAAAEIDDEAPAPRRLRSAMDGDG